MSEDFDPDPRSSKRRKVNTYGSSRSTRPEKDNPVSSVWENVSSGVTGLSRRLFAGKKTPTQPDDSAYVSQDDVPADGEVEEDIRGMPEIAESDSEPTLVPTVAKTGRRTTQAQSSNAANSGSITRMEVVNGRSREVPSTQTKSTASARKQRGVGPRPAPRQLRGQNTDTAGGDTTGDTLVDGVEDDTITVQPRSSGRERKRPRKYSAEPVEIRETPKKPRKSVAIEESDEQIEKDFGFRDISSSTKKHQRPASGLRQISTPSKIPEKSRKLTPEDALVAPTDPELDVLVDEGPLLDSVLTPEPVVDEDLLLQGDDADLAAESPELQRIKAIVLARLTSRAAYADRTPLASHLKGPYDALHTLLKTTVSSGESNSLLLLGSRGSGKSLLVNTALGNLQHDLSTEFHTVRLNGFVQTDDRLALREIWRQLGREMDVDEDETNQVVGSYADTMTSLLGLLSQPEGVPDIGAVEYVGEKVVTKSVVFILDEFDLFTTHPRQTLLYNLFDIAQSRKAPIAVIGCSARTDCVECLEKRVKSRFSHRWVHIGQPKSLAAFEEVARDNLLVDEKRLGSTNREQQSAVEWNEYIKSTFLPSSTIQSVIRSVFYTTKSLPDLFAALYVPIATATISAAPSSTLSSQPPSLLSLLPSLPHIHLALLVCATRLEAIHSLTQLNFNIVYAHYTDLLTKSRVAASASGATASGMRAWGRDVSVKAWEELVRWELLVRVGGKDEAMGEDGRMYRIDVSIEEVRWAVERLGTGAGEGLARWCKEI